MVALAGVARARNVTAGTGRFASQMNDGLRPLLKVGNSSARIVLPSGVACITSAVHGCRKARSYRLKPHHPGDLDLIAIQVCRACLKGKAPPKKRGLDGRSGWLWADTGPPSEFHQIMHGSIAAYGGKGFCPIFPLCVS